jgi:hypothetical protein
VIPIYHVCHFVWDFLAPKEWETLRSAALPYEAYAIWRNQAHREEIDSLYLEQPTPTGDLLSIDRVRKNGCAFSISIPSTAI